MASRPFIKRAYLPPDKNDGYRILVDRLWPRGVTKSEADIDLWLKDVAPSAELRTWFAHDVSRFAEFTRRYSNELQTNASFLELKRLVHHHARVTLVYAAKDQEHNNAVVLQSLLSSL